MKRIIFTALLVTAFVFFSCGKSGNAPSPAAEGQGGVSAAPAGGSPAQASAGTPAPAAVHGYALRVNTAFYTLESDSGSETDKVKWAAWMSLGEKVNTGQERKLTFAGDGEVYTFVETERDDGSRGFAFASQVSRGGNLVVVVDEKANLFSSPKTVDVTGIILPRKIVAASFPETERDGFVEVRAYDPAAQAYRQNFIRVDSLSERDSDIQSSILLQTAAPLKNEGSEKIRKDALLESALLDYSDSVFNAEIQALVNPNTAFEIKTEAASRPAMFVNDNGVNVRDLPDPVAGKVTGQLELDSEVTVSEQTAEESVIDGVSARWYHITAPVSGWVFGAYLN